MKILIVGGGIAGLSLARALERRGMIADLIERQPGNTGGGAGLYLPGNAVRALDGLGLRSEVAEKAFHIREQRILDWRGKFLSSADTEAVWHGCGPCLSLPRNALHEILEASLQHTRIRLGRSIARLTQDREGCEVWFEDGETGRYDLVVGADGINSKVRNIAVSAASPRYVGNVCWRFITRNTADIDCWTVMLGKGRALLAIPVSRAEIYVYADLSVAAGKVDGLSESSDLRSLFAGFGAPVFPLVDNLGANSEVHFGRIEQVQICDWVMGRAVLIGDAAHASSPSMAEGAGMAMEDALVLAEEIGSGKAIDDALQAYLARRRPRVTWVQSQCNARDKMRSLPGMARAAILKLFGAAIYKRSYAPLLEQI
jgi:2-polyprenyl-6-methoxyphenol hydroxylase-like FAD-dependent oxidoreductase